MENAFRYLELVNILHRKDGNHYIFSIFYVLKHSDGRQDACSNRMEYSNGRQNACANGNNTLMADRVLAAIWD